MRRWRVPLLVVVVVGVMIVAIRGCGDEPTDMNIAQARASLQALHRRTAATVAPASKPRVMVDRAPSTCYSDYLVRDLGTVSSRFILIVPVRRGSERAVLDKVVAAWEREGIELYRGRLEDRQAEVTGRADGYDIRVLAVPDAGQVSLSGATDCLDPAPER